MNWEKAALWLYRNAKCISLDTKLHPTEGYAYFYLHIYKMTRDDKPSLYFALELDPERNPISLKRICTY